MSYAAAGTEFNQNFYQIKKRGGDSKQGTGKTTSQSKHRPTRTQTTAEGAPSVDSPEGHSDDELSSGSQDPQ